MVCIILGDFKPETEGSTVDDLGSAGGVCNRRWEKKEYASTKNPALKKVCILAIIGSLAVSLLYIKKLPFVFEMNVIFPLFLMNPHIFI